MRARNASILLLMALPGCTAAWSLDGAFQDKGETLTGAATRYMDGGTIEIYGSRGTHCTGILTAFKGSEAKGKLLCDDRRSGPFTLDTATRKGKGELAGRPFGFTLGKPQKNQPRP